MQGEQVRADRFTATLARHLQHHGGATTAAASAAARVAAAGLSFLVLMEYCAGYFVCFVLMVTVTAFVFLGLMAVPAPFC